MKTFSWLASLAFAFTAGQTINFDSARPGTVPTGWSTPLTRAGLAKWEILKDSSAPSPPYVFGQVSGSPAGGGRFPLAIFDKSNVKDGEISVKLKPVAGKDGRAGGLVWRYRDPDNYYLVLANALDNKVALWKIKDGKRIPLTPEGMSPKTFGVRHPVPVREWSLLKVQFRGPLFSVYFNHRRLFQVQDSTFQKSGKVGLWTKSDSITYFDDFKVAGH
jgi:hypothetical protein